MRGNCALLDRESRGSSVCSCCTIVRCSHYARVFAEHPLGRKKPGFYSCFRIFHDSDQLPLLALVFCFYDGTESSPAIKSLGTAQAFARGGGLQ